MKTLNIEYDCAPSPARMLEAELLLDTRPKIMKAPGRKWLATSVYTIVAVCKGKVVGVASIKRGDKDPHYGELGYLFVSPEYRQQGIAATLTRLRLDYAKMQGIKLLYAVIKQGNVASVANLKKCDFLYFGSFGIKSGSGLIFDWYFLVLESQLDHQSIMQELTAGRTQYSYPEDIAAD